MLLPVFIKVLKGVFSTAVYKFLNTRPLNIVVNFRVSKAAQPCGRAVLFGFETLFKSSVVDTTRGSPRLAVDDRQLAGHAIHSIESTSVICVLCC